MEKIYSKVDPDRLLHAVFRKSEFKEGRQDLIHSDEFIQCSALQLKEGHTFRPHRHLYKEVGDVFPQESWVCVEGQVKCIFYDIDNKIIGEPILNAGDVSFSFGGGHNYLLMKDSLIYEMKIGPYLGQKADKVFID